MLQLGFMQTCFVCPVAASPASPPEPAAGPQLQPAGPPPLYGTPAACPRLGAPQQPPTSVDR